MSKGGPTAAERDAQEAFEDASRALHGRAWGRVDEFGARLRAERYRLAAMRLRSALGDWVDRRDGEQRAWIRRIEELNRVIEELRVARVDPAQAVAIWRCKACGTEVRRPWLKIGPAPRLPKSWLRNPGTQNPTCGDCLP